jgi:hypothetical protein
MCLIGNSAHAAVRGGMSAHRLVHTQANQLNRFELTFASFHFNRFAAAHLRGIQPVAVDRFNHASFARAANHDAAAGGDCIAVTVVCHHGIFSSLTCSLRRYFRVAVHGAYKYACLHHMFLFLIKLTLFSLLCRALTVHYSNLQSRPLFSLNDSFSREALRVGLYS